jgi:hypothetical protein
VRPNCGGAYKDEINFGWTPLTSQTFATNMACTATLLGSVVTESANALSQYTVSVGSAGARVITAIGNATVTGTVDSLINGESAPRGTIQARVDNAVQFTVTTPMTYQLTGNLIASAPSELAGFRYQFGSATMALIRGGDPAPMVSVVGQGPVSSTGLLQPGTYILSISFKAEVVMNIVLNATASAGTTLTLRLTP